VSPPSHPRCRRSTDTTDKFGCAVVVGFVLQHHLLSRPCTTRQKKTHLDNRHPCAWPDILKKCRGKKEVMLEDEPTTTAHPNLWSYQSICRQRGM